MCASNVDAILTTSTGSLPLPVYYTFDSISENCNVTVLYASGPAKNAGDEIGGKIQRQIKRK